MNMKENNKYRYTNTSERNIRMNRFYIIASSLWPSYRLSVVKKWTTVLHRLLHTQ